MRIDALPIVLLCIVCVGHRCIGAERAPAKLSPLVSSYVRTGGQRIILAHVRIIDGSGRPALTDRNVTLEGGKIVALEAGADVAPQAGTEVLDLRGHTALPGIVGMHDHLFYIASPNFDSRWNREPPTLLPQMTFSAPRLYLAAGVTTIRTAGSVEPQADLALKEKIDGGHFPGPHIYATGPYLEGEGGGFIQMRALSGADDARESVRYWAGRGITSFKAYMHITRAELKEAIVEAHRHGLKVTGHLCSVTYPEAVALGIDNLEHGFFPNTQLDPDKIPDQCSPSEGAFTQDHMLPGSREANELIASLVAHRVALTSTLPVFEGDASPSRVPLRGEMLDAMTGEAREAYLLHRERPSGLKRSGWDFAKLLEREMQLERAFVAAGGLLLAGSDPTGDGGVLPGFGDHRGLELLVESGFSPEEAVRIATLNGAIYLGRAAEIGSIAVGKNADLVIVSGDPSQKISDIRNVQIVFKDGVGFDPKKLLASVRGRYGEY